MALLMIPPLTESGLLPPGIHEASLKEVETVFGSGNQHRRQLFARFARGIENLFAAGANWVAIDGSFTTNEPYPNDVDGVWEPGEALDMDILDPVFFMGSDSEMKKRYGLDLYIDVLESATGEPFLSYFQTTRDGDKKGLLVLTATSYAGEKP